MLEKYILDYLNSSLSVNAYMVKPENAPETFVVLEKTSGYEEDRLMHGTIAVQSYAGSLENAALLNEAVKVKMRDIDLPEVGGVKLNNEYNFSDPESGQFRYQAVYNITYYE